MLQSTGRYGYDVEAKLPGYLGTYREILHFFGSHFKKEVHREMRRHCSAPTPPVHLGSQGNRRNVGGSCLLAYLPRTYLLNIMI